ncbi:LysR family transcriptional regulator [Cupriavidus necator]|uniref:LysR family transcriptional regulator n=1 Tax=Cupriavidus necator TaxID=106590 RepID=A0A1U9UTZ3_CUPNE|nr:LysR family transcriptional regulator [Cupriavidus necator]AQV96164.1 LysR family transcriptional regulator [Cupriavidus necator]
MAIDIRDLRCFLAVVSAGSISRAAEHMHLAQPALSLQIKQLEQALRVRLFDRTQRGVLPTAAGLRFVSHARDILTRVDLACEDVRDFVAEPAGRVAIGLPQSMAQILTLALVRETLARWQKVQLQIIELSTGYIPERLLSGDIDIGLTFQADPGAGLLSEHLLDEDLVLVGPPGALCAAPDAGPGSPDTVGQVAFAELADYAMLLPAGLHGLRALIDRHAKSHHVGLRVLAEVNAIPQLIELAAAGVGFTILSYASVRRELRSGLLSAARIVEPSISRPVYLCRSATTPLSMAASAVQALISDTVQALVADGRWPARAS